MSATAGIDRTRPTASPRFDAVQFQDARARPAAGHAHRHGGSTAEEQIQRHVHGRRPGIAQQPYAAVVVHPAEQRPGTAFTQAQGLKFLQPRLVHRQHVALLRFVAPGLQRRHARVGAGNGVIGEVRTPFAVVQQLRDRVAQPTGAYVVDAEDRVSAVPGQAQFATAVDNLLRAPLHLGVAALHRGVVQFFVVGAAAPRGRGTTPHADPHGRSSQHHHQRARR